MDLPDEFFKDLTHLLNRHGIDTKTQTPDFLLASLLTATLNTYETTRQQVDTWKGRPDWKPGEALAVLEHEGPNRVEIVDGHHRAAVVAELTRAECLSAQGTVVDLLARELGEADGSCKTIGDIVQSIRNWLTPPPGDRLKMHVYLIEKRGEAVRWTNVGTARFNRDGSINCEMIQTDQWPDRGADATCMFKPWTLHIRRAVEPSTDPVTSG